MSRNYREILLLQNRSESFTWKSEPLDRTKFTSADGASGDANMIHSVHLNKLISEKKIMSTIEKEKKIKE